MMQSVFNFFFPQRTAAVPTKIPVLGRCFDLQQIFDDLNARFFDGKIQATIGWGRQRPRTGWRFCRSRRIVLGSYHSRRRAITIHPHLDRPRVPRYVIEAVVFHEMCHQLVPDVRVGGRRQMHTRPFWEQVKRYPQHAEALKWERENVRYLLRREPRPKVTSGQAPR